MSPKKAPMKIHDFHVGFIIKILSVTNVFFLPRQLPSSNIALGFKTLCIYCSAYLCLLHNPVHKHYIKKEKKIPKGWLLPTSERYFYQKIIITSML
jgi:hypothetical protein